MHYGNGSPIAPLNTLNIFPLDDGEEAKGSNLQYESMDVDGDYASGPQRCKLLLVFVIADMHSINVLNLPITCSRRRLDCLCVKYPRRSSRR